MKERRKPPPRGGVPAYMATYGDMMTLLMCFFVLLFSMSNVDAEKFKSVMSSFSGGTGVLDGSDQVINGEGLIEGGDSLDQSAKEYDLLLSETTDTLKDFQAFIETQEMTQDVNIMQEGTEVIITFDAILLFDSGKAIIKPQAIPVLEALGEKLNEYTQKGYRMRLEGHTDNVPIKTAQFPSNWELSATRAIAVAKFYIYELGFDAHLISAEGYGEHMPVASNDTPEGRLKNRRVEIKLTKEAANKSY